MKSIRTAIKVTVLGIAVAILSAFSVNGAEFTYVPGITGSSFNLTAKNGQISTPDGGSYLIWGFANGAGIAQYPGSTLIINQGSMVTVTLTNSIAVSGGGTPPNVSIVFPGFEVNATGGVPGILTKEAVSGGTVTYQFYANKPGTYTYYSGTDSALQVEMGLVGTIIVRPTMGVNYAYNHADTYFDREYLFFLSEMDPRIHTYVEQFGPEAIANTDYLANYLPVLWFINGRAAPDIMAEANVPWLPNQPYNAFPRIHPGETMLMRVVGGGRDSHPFHHHGNHARVIARDGQLLQSAPGKGPDISYEVFTIDSLPGGTVDALFDWTGEGLGWDAYGTGPDFVHDCIDGDADGFDDTTHEYCADHGKAFPIQLPGQSEIAFGGFYSGSPYLGTGEALPPGEGGLNPNGGYSFMWHSHTEKEMINFDIFPGGMLTMCIIEAANVEIP